MRGLPSPELWVLKKSQRGIQQIAAAHVEQAVAGIAQWDLEAAGSESGVLVRKGGEQPSRGYYRTDVSGVMVGAGGGAAQSLFP